jgi:hypothetical protein
MKSSRSIQSSFEKGTGRLPHPASADGWGQAFLFLPFRVVVDHQLERVEHGDAARRGFVEVLALAFLQHADVDPRVGLGDADHFGEAAEAFRREPRRRAPTRVGRRGSSQPSTCFSSTSWISLRLESTT